MDGHKHIHQVFGFKKNVGKCDPGHVQCVIMEPQDQICQTESMESIAEEFSGNNSAASTSTSDIEEDASSSSPTSSSESLSSQYGPLYELSDLMNHLPIKRGLSKHYQGKSQSYTSLANVKSLEDLARKVGSCKSYGGLEGHKFGPKAIIAKKKTFKASSFSSSLGNRGNFRAYRFPAKGLLNAV